VDIVADATTWTPDREYDVIVCTEVFEHTPDWRQICKTAGAACRRGGRIVVTCAGPGRHPHSGVEATALQPGEYYANVSKVELSEALAAVGWRHVVVERLRLDTRGTAVKG
jgi:trans-aconitate methyltransferase